MMFRLCEGTKYLSLKIVVENYFNCKWSKLVLFSFKTIVTKLYENHCSSLHQEYCYVWSPATIFQEPNAIKGVEGDPILGIPSGVTFLMDTTHRFPLDSSINRWRMIDIFLTDSEKSCHGLACFKLGNRSKQFEKSAMSRLKCAKHILLSDICRQISNTIGSDILSGKNGDLLTSKSELTCN